MQNKKKIEERAKALLDQMTLKEKIGQLNQTGTTLSCALPGFTLDMDTWFSEMLQGKITKEELDRRLAMCQEDLREKEVIAGEQGSFINLHEDEKVARIVQCAKQSRLKIPVFIGVDVVRGYRTMFPTPLALSCSWDMESVRSMAHVAKREAYEGGVNWTFGPMLDIARDGRWGRIVESPGEDPYLACKIAETLVSEFQHEEPDGCRLLATAKHFAAYGAASGGQDYNTVDMSERMFYENYLPPFKAAIDAGVGAVMSAFNDLNGVPCTMSKWLLTDVLREQMGFDGFVVSDAEGVKQCVAHGAVRDEKEAAKMSFLAGGDMDMASQDYIQYLEALVSEGEVAENDIDTAVMRILKKKIEFGLFEREYTYDPERIKKFVLTDENKKAALEAGKRSAVLLKNDGMLPLKDAVRKILVVGSLADDKQGLMGPWSFTGENNAQVTILEGLRDMAPEGTKITYLKGYSVEDEEIADWDMCREMALQADAVIAVAGENAFMSGEAASKADLHLAGCQEPFILKLAELGKPLTVILVNGRPLAIGKLKNHPGVSAILEGWHLGTEYGHAAAEILYGRYNPSGKLTVTFANEAGQEPMYYNHPNTGKPGGDFKFTSKYLDVPIEPLYPFGYGLSYTTFAYSNLKIEKAVLGSEEKLRCSVQVKNTGKIAGEEVVQLYIRDMAASCVRPVKELKGFEKMMLEPGETKTVRFEIPVSEMGFYNRNLEYIVEPGQFRLYVGTNSVDVLEAAFEVV